MCNKCNKKECNDGCRPQCNPCNKQPQILYCGQPIECLNIQRGDELNRVIKTVGDKVCQILTDVSTLNYVNVEPASDEQCPTGGYVLQVINSGTGEIESETVICDTLINVLENSEEVGTYNSFNFVDGQNTKAEVTDNSNTVDITFNVELSKSITYNEGLDLISNEEIVPGVSYFISDRGIYLKGLSNNTFSTHGTRIMRIVKPNMYEKGSAPNVMGVYHPKSETTAVSGDLFVWGAKVWRATTAVNPITPTSDTNLGTGFVVDNSDAYYQNEIFSVEYHLPTDKILKQTDRKGNSIVYGDTVNCDWGQLLMSYKEDNKFREYLNNFAQDSVTIAYNDIDYFKNNYITSSVLFNNCGELKNNIVHEINSNNVTILNNNIVYSIKNNHTNRIENNSYYTSIRGNHGVEIKNNTTIDNGGEIVEGTLIESNFFERIRDNIVNLIEGNYVEIIFENEFYETILSNYCINISNNSNKEGASGTDISKNRVSTGIYANTGCEVIHSNKCSLISENSSCPLIDNNQCKDVKDNTKCEITQNNIQGDITGNNPTGEHLYVISKNQNNGGIYRNDPTTNSLSIRENVNNGDIGTTVSVTNRNTDITDTQTHK